MEDIEDYFGKSEGAFPETGVAGVESDWMDLGTLEAPHGRLWAGDPWVANEADGCVVQAIPGTYRVLVKGMDFSGHRRLARLRVCHDSAESPQVGQACGETFTDVGMIGAVDMAAMDEAVTDEFAEEYNDDIQSIGEGAGTVQFEYGGKTFEMTLVPSGLGDGSFDVFPLTQDGRSVGMEVEFLPPGFSIDDDISTLGG